MPSLPPPVAAAVLLAFVPGAAPAHREGYAVAQLMIQQRVTVRVPRLSSNNAMLARVKPVTWSETKGPKCVGLATLAGALITQRDAVDLVQAGGGRVRAKLDDGCGALDFYSGFYIRPTQDGMVCAGRDSVRSRSGRKCEIDKFRTLVAKR